MSFFNIPWILVLVFVWNYFLCVNGNALLRPVSRGVKWTRSHHNPTNYNYMGVNCGGIGRFRRNDGQCGLCGDPYDGPRRHEFGGKYATGAITQTYPAGQTTIGVKILINANQGGYFEFRLCEANGKRETQACFDQHLLGIIEASAQGEIDRYYVERTGIIQLNLEIPVGLSCTQCILQWKYTTDNAWGRDALGRGCLGCGPQETFINCADIRIKGWDIVPTTAQLTTTRTTTTTPPPLTTTTELPTTNQQPKTTRTTTTVDSSPTKQQYRSTSIYYTNTVSRKTDKDETRQVFTPAWTQSGHRSTDSAPKTPLDLHYQNSKSKQKTHEDPKRNKPRGPPPRPPPTPHPFIPRPPKLSPEHIKAANKGAKLHIHTSADKTAYIHVHSNPENRGQTAIPTWKPKTSPAPAMNNFYRENSHQASHVHGANHHRASIQHNLRSNPRGAKYDRNRWARPSMLTTPIPESMMNEYSVTASPKYTFRPAQGKDNSRPASWPNRNHRRTDTLGSQGHPSNPRHKGIQTGSRNTRMQYRDHNIRNMPRNTRSNLWYVPTTTPKPKRSDLGAPRRKDNQYSRYDMSYVPGLTKSPDIKKKFKPLSKTFFETPVQRKENNSRYADLGQLELMGVDLDSHGHPITTSTTSFPPGAYDRFPLAQAGVISPRQKELQSLIDIRNRLKQDAEENRFRRPAVFERFTRFKVGKKGRTQKTENARMQSSGGNGVNDLSKPSKGPAYEQNPTIKIKSSVSSNMFNPFLSSIKTQPEVPAPNIHGVDFLRQKPLANEFTHTKHTNTLEKGHTGSDTHGQRNGHGHTQGQGHSPVIIIENTNTGHGHSPQGGVLGLYAHNDTAQNMHNKPYGNIPTTPVPQFQQHHQQSHSHAGASNLNIPAHHDQAHGNMNKVILPNIDPQAYLNAEAGVHSNRKMPMTETDIQRQAGQIFEKTAPPVFNGVFSNMPGQTVADTGFNAVTQPPANQQQQAVIEAMKSSILESINKANHQMQGQNVELQPPQHQHALVNPQTNVRPNWPQADQQTQQSQVMHTAVVNNVQPIPTRNNVQQIQAMNNFPQMPSYHQTQQTHLVNYAGANDVPLVPTMNNIAQIPNTNSFPQKLYTKNVQQTPNMNNGQQMPNMNYDQQMPHMNNAHQMPNLNNVQQMPHMNNGQHIPNMNNGQEIPHMNTVQQFQYMNNGQQIPNVNNGQEISYMNNGQAMQNMNNDQQISYMNNGQQIPNMNNGQQIPNINSFQQVQTMSNSQQMPNTKREISQQFQYQAVESQYQNSGAQNALPNVRNQNVFPNQAFQNPFHNQPIQTLPTDQGTHGVVQRQDFSQINLNTANSLPNQGTGTSFKSQGPQNFYQSQDNGNPFSNELTKDLFQIQAQQNIQQGQGTHIANQNKRIEMVSLQHENIKHSNEGMPQHQNFNDHGVHLKNNIQNEEVSNPAYDIKAATMPSPRNVQAVNTISQGNIDHIVPTTTPPTSPSSTQSELFSIETASAKQLVMELRKLQALSKKGPLTFSQLQQRQALQIQLVKRIHEAQLKQLNKQNGTKPKKGNEKMQETSNGTGPTKHPTKSVLTQSQYQTPQQEHPSRHEAAGSKQQVNLQVNKYKHIQPNHHQVTIGNQKSTVTGHQQNQPNLASENKHSIPNMAVEYKHNQNNMAVGHQQNQANIASEHQHNQPNTAYEHKHNQPNMVSEHQHNQPNMASEHQHNQSNMVSEHQRNQPNMVLDHQRNQPNMASEHQRNQPNMVSEHQRNQPNMVLDHQHNQPGIALDHQHNEPNKAFEHQHHQPNVVAEHKHIVPNMAVEHQHSQKYTVSGSQHNQPNEVAKREHNIPNTPIEHINNQANVAAVHSHSMPNMALGQQQSQANSDHMHTNDHSHDMNNLPVTSDVTAQTTITQQSAVSTATGTQSITNVNPAVTQKSAMKNRLNSFVDKLASRMNNKVSDTKAAGKLQNIQVSPVSREAIMKVLREMALEALRKRGKITENKMAVQNKPTLSAVEVDYGLTREAIKTKSTEPVKRITKRSTPTLYETGSTYRVQSPNGIQNAIRPQNEIATIPMNINKGPSDVLVPIERPTHIIYQPLDIPAHLMPNRFAHHNNNRPTHIVDHPSNGRPNIHESKASRVSLPTTLPNQYQPMQDFQTSVRWGQPEFARWNPSTTAFIDPQITETIPQPQAQGFVPFETVTTPTDFTTQAMHHGKSHNSHNNVDIITNPHNVKEQINSRTISVTSAAKNSYVPKINSDKKLTRQDITELGNQILQQMRKLILRQRG